MSRPLLLTVFCVVAGAMTAQFGASLSAQNATGTIVGHVKLAGPEPGNPVIRMGMDPMCSKLNAGKRPIQEYVIVGSKGELANAFVDLEGNFPNAPAPAGAATLTQKNCVYTPRVVGARAGGTLRISSDDQLLHNVHSVSTLNPFNFSEGKSGASRDITVKGPDVMMRIVCDIHSWMMAYVGVETHPYYAVTGADGTFKIANVPAGKRTVRVWHERYGQLTQTVNVAAGGSANADFSYTGKEKPSKARVQDVAIPLGNAVAEMRLSVSSQ
jgi:plastocyanin